MRLRVRYQNGNTKLTFKVELSDTACFRELKAAVDENGAQINWDHYAFSLNKKTPLRPLGEIETESGNVEDAPVASTGVANGDLLFLIATQAAAASSTQECAVDERVDNIGFPNSSPNQPNSSVSTEALGRSGLNCTTTATSICDKRRTADRRAPRHNCEARSPANSFSIPPARKDAGVSVPDALLQSIDSVLQSEAQLSFGVNGPNPTQYRASAVFAALHAILLSRGLCVHDSIMGNQGDVRKSGAMDNPAVRKHWSTKAHSTYWATYIGTPASPDQRSEEARSFCDEDTCTTCDIKCVSLGTKLVINAHVGLQGQRTHASWTTSINPADYVCIVPKPGYADLETYPNIGLLVRHLADTFVTPVVNLCRASLGLPENGSLLAQVLDVKLLIFRFLDPKSLGRLAQVCKELNTLASCDVLWQRLVAQHFPSSTLPSQHQSWKLYYKFRLVQERRSRGNIVPRPVDPLRVGPFRGPGFGFQPMQRPPLGFPGQIGGEYDRVPMGMPGALHRQWHNYPHS
eukprot:m.389519 g.389519  ORF g.389519 m.389519 type:complete len:518 (+) comp21051_c0_seq5:193-1746(+)